MFIRLATGHRLYFSVLNIHIHFQVSEIVQDLPDDALVDGEDVDEEDADGAAPEMDGHCVQGIVHFTFEHQEVNPNEDQSYKRQILLTWD